MNRTLTPPTGDLFSRQWYDKESFGMVMLSDNLYYRVDSIRKKLEGLEVKLRKELIKENPQSKYTIRHRVLSTVSYVRTFIGVWNTKEEESSIIRMVYPYNTHAMSVWNEDVLGKPVCDSWYPSLAPEGWGDCMKPFCLIMLSDEAVDWLNRVVHWLEKNEKELV